MATEADTVSIFMGNIGNDAKEDDVRAFFEEKGAEVESIDMKIGFAFVYIKRPDDLRALLDDLDGRRFGPREEKVRVEQARNDQRVRNREAARKEAKPSDTLFIANFDPREVRHRDLEERFSQYGKIVRIDIKRTYAFVQYEHVDDAVTALGKCEDLEIGGKKVIVEYVQNQYDPLRRRSPRRGRSDSRDRRRSRRDSRDRDYRRRDRSFSRDRDYRRRDRSYDRDRRSRDRFDDRDRRSGRSRSRSRDRR